MRQVYVGDSRHLELRNQRSEQRWKIGAPQWKINIFLRGIQEDHELAADQLRQFAGLQRSPHDIPQTIAACSAFLDCRCQDGRGKLQSLPVGELESGGSI